VNITLAGKLCLMVDIQRISLIGRL